MLIQYKGTNLTIAPDFISIRNLTNVEWKEGLIDTGVKDYIISTSKDTISIDVSGKGRNLLMRMVRVAEPDVSYINFYFDLLNGKESVDDKIGGLLGNLKKFFRF